MPPTDTPIHEAVRARYGQLACAQREADPDLPITQSACCADSPSDCGCQPALYDAALLNGLPPEVTDLSLGCGDPVTLASLHPGETVLDLGSGGGIDCFLAARQVGPGGHVIGVDMTPEMIARANASRDRLGLENVEFRLGHIEALPVADASVDVIISNCVINLSPDKAAVFREAFRVLRPGGRLSISDIVTEGELSPILRADLEQWVGCVSGAIDAQAYVDLMRQAGFVDIQVVDRSTAAELTGGPRIYSARLTGRRPA